MTRKKAGTIAAVKEAVAAKPLELPTEEQPDMFEDLIGAGDVVKRTRERAAAELAGVPAQRRGRQPGAENRRKREWVDYLLSRYPSPLEGLLQIAVARVDDLVIDIGCTKLEALQEKRIAMAAALPYLHQKQAIAVNVNQKATLKLVIEDLGDAAAIEDGEDVLDGVAIPLELEDSEDSE